jgi:hypothetical protein
MKNMVKLGLGTVAAIILAATQASAVVYFSDTFSYSDGPITNVSGGIWNGFSGSSPVNVTNGQAIVSQALTQDVAANLGGVHSNDVLYLKYDFMFDLLPGPTNATSYFMMFKDNGTSQFIGRTMGGTVTGDAAGTYRLGFNASTGSSPSVGAVSSALSTGTWYTAVFKLDQTAVNAPVMTLWINPTLESDPNVSASSTLANLAVSTIALRQATTEGRVNIDNLVVGDSFSAVVPEPATMVLVGIGLVGLLAIRRRK